VRIGPGAARSPPECVQSRGARRSPMRRCVASRTRCDCPARPCPNACPIGTGFAAGSGGDAAHFKLGEGRKAVRRRHPRSFVRPAAHGGLPLKGIIPGVAARWRPRGRAERLGSRRTGGKARWVPGGTCRPAAENGWPGPLVGLGSDLGGGLEGGLGRVPEGPERTRRPERMN
jgi:hypothetical protein